MEVLTINTQALGTFTDEQFFQFCIQNRDLRFERDKRKNIIVMSPTSSNTGLQNLSIASLLWFWNNENKLGYTFDSSTGFTLPNGSMRSPDAAWINQEHWEKVPQEDKDRFAHICPDFVIELRSKSDSLKVLKQKMQEWVENGCRLAWLIDLAEQKVYIYRKDGSTDVIGTFDEKVSGEDVLPGFDLELTKHRNKSSL